MEPLTNGNHPNGSSLTPYATTVFVGHVLTIHRGEFQQYYRSAPGVPPSFQWHRYGAIAVAEQKIIALAQDLAGLRSYISPSTTLVQLGETDVLMPGFQDAHNHPHAAGMMELQCNLRGLPTLAAALSRIQEYARQQTHLEWIIGSGWEFDWPLTAALLDQVVPDRPAIFRRVDGHAVWVNSRAMAVAKLDTALTSMDATHVDTDADGRPTGVFHESAADHFRQFFGHLTMSERMDGLSVALSEMARLGITAFQDALVRPLFMQSYILSQQRARMKLKASLCLYWDPQKGPGQIEEMKRARLQSCPGLRIATVKLMVDGVIESETASLHEPYCGCGPRGSRLSESKGTHRKHQQLTRSSSFSHVDNIETHANCGVPNFEREMLFSIVELLDREKFQIHCHAVGDKAVTDCLDALEHARQVNGVRDSRHQIAHIQLLRREDVPRFRDLDVVANFQPYWTMPDKGLAIAESLLGRERAQRQYLIRTMLEAGVKISFGSDWNVSSLSPFDGIQAVVTHLPIGSSSSSPATDTPWNPAERLSVAEAMACYTLGSAHANFLEEESGTLEVGRRADFVILDQNLLAVPHDRLHRTQVKATYVNGECIYQRIL